MSHDTLVSNPTPPAPPQPPTTESSLARRLLIAVLVAVGTVVVVFVMLTVFLVTGSRQIGGGSVESSGALGQEPASGAVVVAPEEAVVVPADEAVADFLDAWTVGDWEAMLAVADDDVVRTAQEFHVEGGEVQTYGPARSDGGGLLYSHPTEGRGLIFAYGVAVDGNGSARIADLTFGGDAG